MTILAKVLLWLLYLGPIWIFAESKLLIWEKSNENGLRCPPSPRSFCIVNSYYDQECREHSDCDSGEMCCEVACIKTCRRPRKVTNNDEEFVFFNGVLRLASEIEELEEGSQKNIVGVINKIANYKIINLLKRLRTRTYKALGVKDSQAEEDKKTNPKVNFTHVEEMKLTKSTSNVVESSSRKSDLVLQTLAPTNVSDAKPTQKDDRTHFFNNKQTVIGNRSSDSLTDTYALYSTGNKILLLTNKSEAVINATLTTETLPIFAKSNAGKYSFDHIYNTLVTLSRITTNSENSTIKRNESLNFKGEEAKILTPTTEMNVTGVASLGFAEHLTNSNPGIQLHSVARPATQSPSVLAEDTSTVENQTRSAQVENSNEITTRAVESDSYNYDQKEFMLEDIWEDIEQDYEDYEANKDNGRNEASF